MKRVLLSVAVVVLLGAIGAVAVFAAPNDPGWGSGMMGSGVAGHMNGQGVMGPGVAGHMNGQGMNGRGHMAWCDWMGDGEMMHDDLEDVLGLTPAEIHAAHISGKSLVEIAAGQGVDEQTLKMAVLDGRRVALDRAVADGRLTQAQADEAFGSLAASVSTMLNAKGMGRGMMGGMTGGMYGASPCHG